MTDDTKLRGVNLGGWLVLEKWMTPSLFAGTKAIDEYTFMQTSSAQEKIERHRKTFITEDDFKWLQQNGLNAVRIPIGYWIFDGDDPYIPAISYLDWAVRMAKKYELKVLIDLHGLKGSQNGNDHSGRIGKSDWYRHREYRQQSIDVLERLARRYYDEKAVWGIEIINEPKSGWVQWKLRNYYKQAYERLRQVARPGLMIVFHDGFTPRLLSGALKPSADHPVVMDVHWYQFGGSWRKWEKLDGYFQRIMRRTGLLRRLQRRQPIIIGEWSVVLSGEILDGRSKQGAQLAFKRHGELQLEVYETALGWFYWTYKTEGRGIWHFRSLVEDGLISFQ
ncbi:MAG: glycoside hydrolase family 5 protein [Candidatus Saccharimonadales bacterium]